MKAEKNKEVKIIDMNWQDQPSKLLIIFLLISIPICLLALFTGNTKFTCERLERNYVTCQQEESIFYGFIPRSNLSFRLRGANVEEKRGTDDEGNVYYVYYVYLRSSIGNRILLDAKRSQPWANTQKGKIENLILGNGNSYFIYKRGGFWRDLGITILLVIGYIYLLAEIKYRLL